MDEHPLTYQRTKLVEVMKERLAENEKKRADEKAKAAARNKKVRDQIVELMDEHPQFLVYLAGKIGFRDGALVPGSEAYKEYIEKSYGKTEASESVELDVDLKRLIRVYDQAVDTEVKVSVNDDVFHYL